MKNLPKILAIVVLLIAMMMLLIQPADAIRRVGTPQAASTTTGTTLTINMPAGVVSGNICWMGGTALGGRTFTSTGWTQINSQASSNGEHSTYCHDGTNSEPASYNFTFSSGGFPSGIIACYADTQPCSKQAEVAAGSNNGTSTNLTWATVTTVLNNDWLFATGGYSSDGTHTITGTCEGTFTQQQQSSAPVSGAFGTIFCDKGPIGTGPTGSFLGSLNFQNTSATLLSAIEATTTSTATPTPTPTPTSTATPASGIQNRGILAVPNWSQTPSPFGRIQSNPGGEYQPLHEGQGVIGP